MSMIFYTVATTGVASEQFDNEVVIINVQTGSYYNITEPSAVAIWNLLRSPVSVPQIVQSIVSQFETTPDTATPVIERFIHQLLTELLIVSTASSDTVVAVSIVEKKPFTDPVLQIFDDMQDLLILDPVHDVNAQKGWPYKQ
jgi:Coenzyme PQQ synthesis protein D (PqqD)